MATSVAHSLSWGPLLPTTVSLLCLRFTFLQILTQYLYQYIESPTSGSFALWRNQKTYECYPPDLPVSEALVVQYLHIFKGKLASGTDLSWVTVWDYVMGLKDTASWEAEDSQRTARKLGNEKTFIWISTQTNLHLVQTDTAPHPPRQSMQSNRCHRAPTKSHTILRQLTGLEHEKNAIWGPERSGRVNDGRRKARVVWRSLRQVERERLKKGRQVQQQGVLFDRQSKAEWETGRVNVSMIQQYSGRGKMMMKGPGGGWWCWGDGWGIFLPISLALPHFIM